MYWWTSTPNSRDPEKLTCSRAFQLSAVELRVLAGSVSIGWRLKAVEMRDLCPVVEAWPGVAAGCEQGARALCGRGAGAPWQLWGQQGG